MAGIFNTLFIPFERLLLELIKNRFSRMHLSSQRYRKPAKWENWRHRMFNKTYLSGHEQSSQYQFLCNISRKYPRSIWFWERERKYYWKKAPKQVNHLCVSSLLSIKRRLHLLKRWCSSILLKRSFKHQSSGQVDWKKWTGTAVTALSRSNTLHFLFLRPHQIGDILYTDGFCWKTEKRNQDWSRQH